jgi:hypothetical protein
MRGVRFESAFSRICGIASFSLAGVFENVMPRSSKNDRNWLITEVRRAIRQSVQQEPAGHLQLSCSHLAGGRTAKGMMVATRTIRARALKPLLWLPLI